MNKIKKQPSLWALKARAWCLHKLALAIPTHMVRRWYLKAHYRAWDAETEPDRTPSAEDVYDSGFEWSRRPLPTAEADRLLALHDAAAEEDFTHLLERHIRH